MIVRALDSTGDWLYGKGQQDYLSGNAAVGQSIKTRVSSWLGNCFFAVNDGIDWANLLNKNTQLALNLAIAACIINTQDVTGLLNLSVNTSNQRAFSISYAVQTVYSTQGYLGNFTYAVGS